MCEEHAKIAFSAAEARLRMQVRGMAQAGGGGHPPSPSQTATTGARPHSALWLRSVVALGAGPCYLSPRAFPRPRPPVASSLLWPPPLHRGSSARPTSRHPPSFWDRSPSPELHRRLPLLRSSQQQWKSIRRTHLTRRWLPVWLRARLASPSKQRSVAPPASVFGRGRGSERRRASSQRRSPVMEVPQAVASHLGAGPSSELRFQSQKERP